MRIIAGSRRGTVLTRLDAVNTRPTADRVRESLFNVLQGGQFGSCVYNAHVIDLFAGSGALGLEALSRGAAHASFIETNQDALVVIRANIAKLRFQDCCDVIAGNATGITRWRSNRANLVFADAPYASGDGLLAVVNLARIDALASDAVLVIETDKTETLDKNQLDYAGLTLLKQRGHGRAMLHFLKLKS